MTKTLLSTLATLFVVTTASTSLFANELNEKYILSFSEQVLSDKGVDVEDIIIVNSENIDENWEAVTIRIQIELNGEKTESTETLLVNGNYIVTDAINMKDMSTLKNKIAMKLSPSDYQLCNLIAGQKNSKNKFVIISDPFCPFCKQLYAKIIEKAKKSKNTAVYLAEIPIRKYHPASELVIKHILASKNIPNAVEKVYMSKDDAAIIGSTDFDTINEWFNKTTGEHILKDEIGTKVEALFDKVESRVNELNVASTPTVYLNGRQVSKEKILSFDF